VPPDPYRPCLAQRSGKDKPAGMCNANDAVNVAF